MKDPQIHIPTFAYHIQLHGPIAFSLAPWPIQCRPGAHQRGAREVARLQKSPHSTEGADLVHDVSAGKSTYTDTCVHARTNIYTDISIVYVYVYMYIYIYHLDEDPAA